MSLSSAIWQVKFCFLVRDREGKEPGGRKNENGIKKVEIESIETTHNKIRKVVDG